MILTDQQYSQYENAVKDFIEKHCLIKQNMPGKLPGSRYRWMFYLKNGLFNADFLQCITEMMLYRIHKELGDYNFQICGSESAATPIVAAMPIVAKMHDIKMGSFIAREERKTYGLKNWHEGMAFNKIPYVLVDEMSNVSMSLRHADHIARNVLKLPSANLAVVIVDRKTTSDSKDMHLPSNVKVVSLFNLSSFNLSDSSANT